MKKAIFILSFFLSYFAGVVHSYESNFYTNNLETYTETLFDEVGNKIDSLTSSECDSEILGELIDCIVRLHDGYQTLKTQKGHLLPEHWDTIKIDFKNFIHEMIYSNELLQENFQYVLHTLNQQGDPLKSTYSNNRSIENLQELVSYIIYLKHSQENGLITLCGKRKTSVKVEKNKDNQGNKKTEGEVRHSQKSKDGKREYALSAGGHRQRNSNGQKGWGAKVEAFC